MKNRLITVLTIVMLANVFTACGDADKMNAQKHPLEQQASDVKESLENGYDPSGSWISTDDVTSIDFYADGTGIMVSEGILYDVTWELTEEGQKISVNFKEHVEDEEQNPNEDFDRNSVLTIETREDGQEMLVAENRSYVRLDVEQTTENEE